jgi:site-specific DNA recombinase
MKPRNEQALRCAIYTRKSSEEGLEQEFNSLHARGRLVRRTAVVSRGKAGDYARPHITTGAFPARRWSVQRSSSC